MRIRFVIAVFACSVAAYASPLAAGECVKQSPQHRVALVELYTSEGCNSCPPADRWMSAIDRGGYTADQLIPLSMHVDYWDQLGWKDRYADRRFSERQSFLSSLAKSRVVYTPEVFVNLREFRNWDSAAQFKQALRQINAMPALADIHME